MQLRCVTSWNADGYRIYGRQFLDSYARHVGLPLELYVEGEQGEIPDWVNLIPLDETEYPDYWQSYPPADNWQHNVRKFSKKAWAQIHAMQEGPFIWLDGDIIWRENVDVEDWAAKLRGVDLAYMARRHYHPCTSWVGFNTEGPGFHKFSAAYRDCYARATFLTLPEWHDAYIFGYLAKTVGGIKTRNISPPCAEGCDNVFDMVFPEGHHKKGNLKYTEDQI